ncbi:MAG TPA: PA14 domain-containing protein [Gemmatimonadaceae bacterium]|nr:PA14 domain-containing protein [Gemmatimonadaceae bacterium]
MTRLVSTARLLTRLVVGAALVGCGRPSPAPAPAPSPRAAAETVAVVHADPVATAPRPWRAAEGRLMTRWASQVTPDRVHPEYPRPQLVRGRWQSLNGLWQFARLDSSSVPGVTGDPHRLARPSRPGGEGPAGPLPMPEASAYTDRILVPFAPEAALSGIMRRGDRVAYRRTFVRPADMTAGERLLLHVGACDWHCTIHVNGRMVADHTGGYDAFSVDVTDALRAADLQELVVAVYDPTDRFGQPRGKQVSTPEGIWYTPVTGLWQSVWLEPVPASSLDALRLTPDVRGAALRLVARGRGTTAGQRVRAVASIDGREVGRVEGEVGRELRVPVPAPRLWSPEDPVLYDLQVTLVDAGGRALDSVDSYFGMRTIGKTMGADGHARFTLNGRPVFMLGPLDQGWWPDGLYTAPTDEALRYDLEMTKALGFNMTRKHIKVEPARWYYHADRLGLLVWQDMPSGWNDTEASQRHFERELGLMLEDLHNHPSIVVWVPFNEKWGQFATARVVGLVQAADSSRLVNDASGWQHEDVGDIIDVHRYQGPQQMRGAQGRIAVVGEFGGLGLKETGHTWAGDAWGYGGLFPTRQALQERYDLLLRRLWSDRASHGVAAGVYTQMTDVEVELNGFTTYDRAVTKFDTARTAAVNRGLAPFIQPELPEFVDQVRVDVTTGMPAEIRVTTDGSEPTAASPVYRAPFTIRANTVVRARSFVDGRPTAAPEARVDYRRVPGRAPVQVAGGVTSGLQYAVYHDTTTEPAFRMHWPVRWQLERPEVRATDIAPSRTGTTPTVSLAPADTTEMFGMRFTGYVRVPRAGVYRFTAVSDDGAAMWVGDRAVFWSVGQSPKSTETSGDVALAAGLHPITVTYFQAYGPRALELYVTGPGLRRQPLAASMLFRDRAAPAGAAGAASSAPASSSPLLRRATP